MTSMTMGERNPDTSAGVYVTIYAAVFALCAIGAFVLPPSFTQGKWIGMVALVGLIAGVPVLDRVAHRSRIREAVEEMGGSVVRIRRLPFWRQFGDSMAVLSFLPIARRIRHEVDYIDPDGLAHHASCLSGWFHGVRWVEDNVVDAS
jgi:hypothetical protein